jgi:hypothetical protein
VIPQIDCGEIDEPVTASTWPADSIGSRTAALITLSLMPASLMPFSLATAGQNFAAGSPSTTPRLLPSSSASDWMPRLLRAMME